MQPLPKQIFSSYPWLEIILKVYRMLIPYFFDAVSFKGKERVPGFEAHVLLPAHIFQKYRLKLKLSK